MTAAAGLPTASVSLDLDNLWSYLKTHGDAGWGSYPSYLGLLVPRVLAFLRDRQLTITFFVVGQDAALEINREPLQAIVEAGHEIGNHSFCHEPWLQRYDRAAVAAELSRAEDALGPLAGGRPAGFRGPGFSLSRAVLEELERRGYLYDASTFPTFLGPLARAYYFRSAPLAAEARNQRALLFGGAREGLRPIRPYRWRVGDRGLIEIPVTTMPVVRTPIHLSYLLYLSTYSCWLAVAYFDVALRLCRSARTGLSFLLHPLDFLGRDDVRELDFFPAMRLAASRKRALVEAVFRGLAARFRIVGTGRHAEQIASLRRLPEIAPCFPNSPAG